MKGRVLVIAGSDSGGGAGIQADIKTITALGGYAATAITALTAQDTCGVHEVLPVPPAFVARQMRLVLGDIGADALKTGMLVSAPVIMAVAEVIEDSARDLPLVLDPVMVATSGDELLDMEAALALKTRLFPQARLLTPNIPEAEALTGLTIDSREAMERAALALLAMGPQAVLLKGGHGTGTQVLNVLAEQGRILAVSARERLEGRHSHGTGCTLASAIAIGLAQGLTLAAAVDRAERYVHEAIRAAPGFGAGCGPLDHGHSIVPFGD
jgi:hydroxymethylpyrimidine/phosphomethylpyrimidine kinase